ncbi:MAG: hypothetical protein Q9157_003700 [Trypethelium eluteriae]
MAASCLEECPNEILGQIFKTLPDFQTLKALVLTRPAFYSLFINRQQDYRATCEFFDSFHDDRQSLLDRKWTARDGASIHKIHITCINFAGKFASEALSGYPLTPERSQEKPASERELLQIVRIFYRTELQCNIFRLHPLRYDYNPHSYHRDQQKMFWDRYAPWENEQLECVLH